MSKYENKMLYINYNNRTMFLTDLKPKDIQLFRTEELKGYCQSYTENLHEIIQGRQLSDFNFVSYEYFVKGLFYTFGHHSERLLI